MRFIKLEELSLVMLKEMHKNHPLFVMRERAQILLFSHKGVKVNKIGELLEIERKTVLRCFDRWEINGLIGLYTKKGQGCKPLFTEEEGQKIKNIVGENPRKIDLSKIEAVTGKKASKSTIKRVLKKLKMVWKRVRRSLKGKRDEADFQEAKKELDALHQLEDAGKVAVYYFDESGFSTVSNVPYAWQPIGKNIEINTAKSASFNVAGFMKRDNTLHSYSCVGSINSKTVVAFFDDFCKNLQQEYEAKNSDEIAYIIIDNAPIHTSHLFKEQVKKWESKGNIIIKRLPTYSPELNLIEILWRFIKYQWIDLEAYQSLEKLTHNVIDILKKFGTQKCTINFG